jgi:hypothetical protein
MLWRIGYDLDALGAMQDVLTKTGLGKSHFSQRFDRYWSSLSLKATAGGQSSLRLSVRSLFHPMQLMIYLVSVETALSEGVIAGDAPNSSEPDHIAGLDIALRSVIAEPLLA